MLYERGQSQRPHSILFHLYEKSRIDSPIEKESKLVVARSMGKRECKVTVNSFGGNLCSKINCGNDSQYGNLQETIELYTSNGGIVWYVNYIEVKP